MTDTHPNLKDFENIIDVHFRDPELLRRSLTHRSFVNEVEDEIKDNERLEFLGDAILDFIVADMLFRRFSEVSEGELTQLRAALVRTDSLAILAENCHLGEYLLMGKGEENSGGRERVNNLCRGFEALIGGIYMDSGIEVVSDFVMPRLNELLEYVLEHDLHKDARSMLQERSQAELRFTPIYRLVEAQGPDHEKEFIIEVVIGNIIIGEGVGTSKRAAAQSAARIALKKVEENGWTQEVQDAIDNYHAQQAKIEAREDKPKAKEIEIPDGIIPPDIEPIPNAS